MIRSPVQHDSLKVVGRWILRTVTAHARDLPPGRLAMPNLYKLGTRSVIKPSVRLSVPEPSIGEALHAKEFAPVVVTHNAAKALIS